MGRVLIAAQPAEWQRHYLAGAPFPAITDRTVCQAPALERVLAKVGSQGWCLVDQELEIGLRSMAVPIHAPSGAVVAAMNVSMPTRRGSVEATRREVLPALRSCAAEIEADLAAGTPPTSHLA
jgi:IclR family pca regulon transcriptional regulator